MKILLTLTIAAGNQYGFELGFGLVDQFAGGRAEVSYTQSFCRPQTLTVDGRPIGGVRPQCAPKVGFP